MDIIAACIESGCYSAVFAIMLVFAVRTHIRREEYYRRIIGELTASLHDLEHVNVRLDEIIKLTGSQIRSVHFNEKGDLVAAVERK